jgi:hypothetical protein
MSHYSQRLGGTTHRFDGVGVRNSQGDGSTAEQ